MEDKTKLRDMFAAAALTGILAHRLTSGMTDEEFVQMAYQLADEMLVERKKEPV